MTPRPNIRKQIKEREDEEVDIHVWKQREDETMSDTYTISVGKRALCHYATKDDALECLSEYLDEL